MVVLAHNIRSLFNIGAFFRNCDAFGVETLYLTGYTATPPRPEIAKTALGADETVPWEHAPDILALIDQLKAKGFLVVGFETGEDCVSVDSFSSSGQPVAAVFGNEPDGIPADVLAACDLCVEIPMRGQKSSLNVAVASGVALFALASQTP